MDSSSRNAPVAVRVIRPYSTEEGLLAVEASAFTRTGVSLLGAPSRPSGVVIRFEICLQDGSAVMRGEGRVTSYRPPQDADPGALTVRFTRLDVQSKELLDRAVMASLERRSLAAPGPARPPVRPSVAAALRSSTSPPEGTPSSVPPQTRPDALDMSPPPLPVIPDVAPLQAWDDDNAPPTVEVDTDEMDVDEADLSSADESDLTVQQPPVALREAAGPEHGPKEKGPVPMPSPGAVPAPHPVAPKTPPPQRHAPERSPAPKGLPPEHMPAPSPSPEQKRKATAETLQGLGPRESRPEFRPTLEPPQRDEALKRLRNRPKNDPA